VPEHVAVICFVLVSENTGTQRLIRTFRFSGYQVAVAPRGSFSGVLSSEALVDETEPAACTAAHNAAARPIWSTNRKSRPSRNERLTCTVGATGQRTCPLIGSHGRARAQGRSTSGAAHLPTVIRIRGFVMTARLLLQEGYMSTDMGIGLGILAVIYLGVMWSLLRPPPPPPRTL
jgi:hypothetical protein